MADGQDGFWGKAPKIFGSDTEINIDSSHTTSMIVQVQENMLSEWVFAESVKCQDDATHHISALALNQRCHINFWQDFKCFSDETQGLVACPTWLALFTRIGVNGAASHDYVSWVKIFDEIVHFSLYLSVFLCYSKLSGGWVAVVLLLKIICLDKH